MRKLLMSSLFIIRIYLSRCSVVDVDYFVHVDPTKNLIVCSDTEEYENKKIMNEIEVENGFTCLLKLHNYGVYKIKLHFKKIEGGVDEQLLEDLGLLDTFIKIKLGEKMILKKLKVNSREKDHEIIVKFEREELYMNTDDKCFKDISQCNFVKNEGSLILKNLLVFNINFQLPAEESLILIEKSAKDLSNSECEFPCVNGICSSNECYCSLGYMGKDCSVKAVSKDLRVSLLMLIFFFAAALLLGILLTIIIFYICVCICSNNDKGEESKEVDTIEHWSLGKT